MLSSIEKNKYVTHYWWIFMLSGVGMIALSLYVAVNQLATYDHVSFLFAAILTATSIMEFTFCILNRKAFSGWGWYITGSIFDLAFATIFITNPILAAISLPFFVGFWLLIRSAVMIGRSIQIKKKGHEEWPWLLFWAATGSFFSVINIYNPVFGEERLVIWTAVALLTVGIFYLHFGWLIRKGSVWIDRRIRI